jgi:hypothetical protein
MPVQLNLKELFTTDSQAVLADKLNFNFTKLIELGIGDVGPAGPAGSTGPIGPAGQPGPRGVKGSTIFSGANQNTNTTAVVDDIFITNGGQFYTKTANAWSQIFDIQALLATSTDLFLSNRLFTIGDSDPAYTTTTKKKNYGIVKLLKNAGSDLALVNPDGINYGSSAATYNNATLFLNNFDLDAYKNNFVPAGSVDALITDVSKAITTIYSNFVTTSDESASRYHIQLGSLYKLPGTTQHQMSASENNLRIKHSLIQNTTASPSVAYFLSEFNVGGDTSYTNSVNGATSAFKFRASQMDGSAHNGVTLYSGGSSAIQSFSDNDSLYTINGLLVERATSALKTRIALGVNSSNGATLLTKTTFDILATGDVSIGVFGTSVTDTKRIIAKRFGNSDKTTALGIGGSPNSSLTIYGTKSTGDSVSDTRYLADQVNIGTMSKNSVPISGSGLSELFKPRRADLTNPTSGNDLKAAQLASYLGFNSYFDDNGNMTFTYRDDNPASVYGTGSAFVTTRDGSMHFLSYSNDPALVDTNTGSNLNETV